MKIIYLSRLKALACVAVVILHSFYAANAYATTESQHILMLTIRNLCMWAVPCFVMATGTLLLRPEKEITFKKLFGKMILKMVIVLVVFTLLFAIFDSVFINKNDVLTTTYQNILYDSGWKHMWYLYLMIAIYLMLPLCKSIVNNKNILIYTCVLLFIFMSLKPTIETIVGKQTAFYICTYSVYPLFLFAGYLIHNKILKLSIYIYLLGTIIGLSSIAVLTYMSRTNKILSNLLSSYSFPIIVLTAICIYGLFNYNNESIRIIDVIALELEKCSFGIYLIHMAILKYILVVMKVNLFEYGLYMVIIISIVTLVISYLITRSYILIKSKLIKV